MERYANQKRNKTGAGPRLPNMTPLENFTIVSQTARNQN
jgi:hypothetical protein